MGVSSAVDWWEEWQLRILVLGSLFVQWFLFISSIIRKYAIPSWFRPLIWLAYLGSDALAIYALATLFSRQRKQDYGSVNSNGILEVVWAPVLLMHLGGRDYITAYNIEDNELWTRHVLTALSQITVAIYVFCKSWPGGDNRLLQASILFFVPGILKCIEKPWALKSASFNSLVSLSKLYSGRRTMIASNAAPHQEWEHWIGRLLPSWLSRSASKAARYLERGHWIDRLLPACVSRQASNRCSPSREGAPCGSSLSSEGERGCSQFEDGISRIGETVLLQDYVQKVRDTFLANYHPQAQGEASEVDLEANHQRQLHEEGDAPEATWLWRLIPDFGQRLAALSPEERKEREEKKEREQRQRVIMDLGTRKLFVDHASLYHDRLSILKTFLFHDDKKAYASLQEGLFSTFDLLYTKAKMVGLSRTSSSEAPTLMNFFSLYIRGATMYLTFAAIGLFHMSHREAYNISDVMVTYALFCCTAVLETFSSSIFPLTEIISSKIVSSGIVSSGMVSQYNLIGFFVRNKRHSKKMCILSSFKCKDFLDQRLCMESCSSSSRITDLVFGHVKGWWKNHIIDVESYRKFNDHRGQWTIQHTRGVQDLEWSLNRAFDESVLLWHIATDLCVFQHGGPSVSHEKAKGCRQISNYMMYLLFTNPEMLLPGTRRNLFWEANAELEDILEDDKASLKAILKGGKPSLMDILKGKGPSPEEIESGFMDRIITKLQPVEDREEDPGCIESPTNEEQYPPEQEGFIQDGWKISQVLLALDNEKMWEVIEGVWVEMLCFSASRCRGFLHAKSLGTGIELLTYIWFMLSRMGMETLPERLQRTELPAGKEGSASATPSTSQTYGTHPTCFRRSRPHEEDAAGASTSQDQVGQAD